MKYGFFQISWGNLYMYSMMAASLTFNDHKSMLLQIPLDITYVTIEKMDATTKGGFAIMLTSTDKRTICQHCCKYTDKFYGQCEAIPLRYFAILNKPV